MDNTILARNDALVSGAALLAVVVAVLLLFAAKPSGAQAAPTTLTVDQTEIGFGALAINGGLATRTITVTNTGGTPIVIGGAVLTGEAGEVLDFTTSIDPASGLTVAAGGTNTFTVTFDPSAAGTRDAVLSLAERLVDGTIGGTVTLVGEAGQRVTGVDLSGSGSQNDPFVQTGAQGCDIVGTPRGETLTGTDGGETICGLGGNDKINGRGGNDVLKGGSGSDRVTDKKGRDRLLGQGGRDTLNAKDGNRGDLLNGGGGKDRAVKDKRDRAKSI
jgi:Ca2+-binding RTX toxin-like protein